MLPVKPYTVAVPANGSLQMQVTGRYFRVNACSNPITVSIDGLGTLGQIGAGQGFKLPASEQPFQRLMFADASGAVNNVTFIVADSDFVDNTVLGSVSVIDGGKARTISGQVFGWRSFQPVGAAGTFNWCLLWNPAGSGKRLVIKAYVSNVSATAGITNSNAGWTAGAVAGGQNGIQSKLSGGAAAASQVYQLQQAAPPAGLAIVSAAPQNVNVVEPEPYVILPGFGFTMQPDGTALSSSFSAHVVEEVIA